MKINETTQYTKFSKISQGEVFYKSLNTEHFFMKTELIIDYIDKEYNAIGLSTGKYYMFNDIDQVTPCIAQLQVSK